MPIGSVDFAYRFGHYDFPILYSFPFIGLATHGTENLNNFLGTTSNGIVIKNSYMEIGLSIPTDSPSTGSWDAYAIAIGY